MDPERWRQIEELFHAASDRAPNERAAFLEAACPDPDLRKEVHSLLETSEDDELETTALIIPPTSLVGQLIGNYEIVSLLGKGGMGEVYLARDPALERKVAIKLLPADLTHDTNRMRRFAQEARAASALTHPNIVSIYGFHKSEFGQYIVMELIEGRSLRSFAPLPMTSAVIAEIGSQVAWALEATHAAGLVHRDLKPDNIMVRPDGLVKVLDFGLARLAGPVPNLTETGLTLPGAIIGTARYMSPEQARGEWLTSASDIFSLGIVFYELATGTHPFEADSALGYMHSIMSRRVIPPSKLNPDLPGWLESLLLRMLEKDADKRCTAADVASALTHTDSTGPRATGVESVVLSRRLVGRRQELAELHAALQSAAGGRGTMLCVSGEPGQGKTALIEEFLLDLASQNRGLIARGRCSERLAGAGAYLPILEVLDSLLNGVERELASGAMKNLAPSWYSQIVSAAHHSALENAPSQDQLKREMAAMLQEISGQQPLVIFLDDVHWADLATIDLLSYLSTQLDRIRVLILVSFRAAEMHSANHPFLQLQLEMQTRGSCRELALGFLTLEDIREYIDLRFPDHRFPDEFAGTIQQRTEGNPLFVSDLLRYLQDHGAIVQQDDRRVLAGTVAEMLTGMPDSVRSMVQRKMEQLGEEARRLLTAASVQGYDFDSSVLAQALAIDPADVEESLEKLERRSALVRLVDEHEHPDRTLTLRYRFVHVLYQDALYASLRPTRRASLSHAVAEALLHFYGKYAGRIAAQLGALFEGARDFERAAANYQIASQNALRLFAASEAETLAKRGLKAVQAMPDTPDRTRVELALQSSLSSALRDRSSHASTETAASHRRVQQLSQEAGDQTAAFFAEAGLFWSALATSDFAKAREQAGRCLDIAEKAGDDGSIMQAKYLMGYSSFHLADHADSDRNLRAAIALYDPARHEKLVATFGMDVRANGLALLALNQWYSGFPDQARAAIEQAIGFARAIPHPVPLSVASVNRVFLYDFFDDPQEMLTSSDEVIAIAMKHGLQRNTLFWGKFGRGWAVSRLGNPIDGLAAMREAAADAETARMSLARPAFGYAFASTLLEHGQNEEALEALDKYTPQAEQSGPREKLSEMYRLRGELLLRRNAPVEAERSFLLAIETAREFGAKSNELRAAMSLARLYREKGDAERARRALSGVWSWFSEGFDTPDLKKAKAQMDSLTAGSANAASV